MACNPYVVEKVKHYFGWQFKLASRSIRNFGLPPAIGYILLALIIVALPLWLLPSKPSLPWIYAVVGAFATSFGRAEGRDDFLKNCYSKREFLLIRTMENLLLALPFSLVLLIHKQFLLALALFSLAFLLGITSYNNHRKLHLPALPTPFSKRPFEFALGFRVSFLIFMLLYYVVAMAIVHDNFNLGIVAVYAVFIVCLCFYQQMEPEYYVWIYEASPKRFLFQKLRTAFVYTSTLVVLPLIALSVWFPSYIGFLLVAVLAGFMNLAIVILLKYKEFPKPFHIGDGLLIAACLICPIIPIPFGFLPIPLLFILYEKAQKNLNNYL